SVTKRLFKKLLFGSLCQEKLVLPSGVDQIRQAITDHAGDQQRCKRILVHVLRQVFTRTLALPIEHIARRACLLARLIPDIANHRLESRPGGLPVPFQAVIERVLSRSVCDLHCLFSRSSIVGQLLIHCLAPTENSFTVRNICCKERLPSSYPWLRGSEAL